MTRREAALFTLLLALLGAGWGITQPLAKIAVSTGYRPFGLIFWQLVIGAAFLTAICLSRGLRLPLAPRFLAFYLMIAVIGTVLPNSTSYQAVVHLPAGIMSLLLSMVPMFAFPAALALGQDTFSWRRLGGLFAGLVGVLMLVAPGANLSMDLPVFWVLVGLVAGMCYAFEGNIVAKWGTHGLNALQVLWGASLIGALLALPLALGSGQFIDPRTPFGSPEWALVASSMIHVLVYAAYVWMVGRAGPVFAVQVSYLVTGFGLIWARLILSEAYAPTLWIALAFMFFGMYLVQPRPKVALAADTPIGEGGR